MTTQPNHSTNKQSYSGPKHYYFIAALMSVSVIYKTCEIHNKTQKTLTKLNNDFDMILLLLSLTQLSLNLLLLLNNEDASHNEVKSHYEAALCNKAALYN